MDTISTKRLTLRSLEIYDLSDFYEYAKHPDVGPNAGWKPLESLESAANTLLGLMEKDDTWAIVENISGKVIGTIALRPDKRRNHDKAKEIGYVLNPAFWGNGYMLEIVKAVINHAFEKMDLLIISIDHYPFNQRSKKVIEKAGFLYEGTLRLSCKIYTGEIYDHVCYSMTKDDYKNLF